MEEYLIWIPVVMHLILCLVMILFHKSLGIRRVQIPVLVLIPFWGALCILMYGTRADRETEPESGKEGWTREEIFENIFADTDREGGEVVPLEEALLMNGSREKRELMMDMLYDDPEAYIDLLMDAGRDDDVEVVHYATTAMAEISKEYDVKLQSIQYAWEREPEDEELLNDYCALLGKYLSLGLLRGQPLRLQRSRYEKLLEKKKDLSPLDLKRKAENELELQCFDKAQKTLAALEAVCPEDEDTWLLQIKYHALLREGSQIQKLIDDMEMQKICISQKGQDIIDFWKDKRS